MEREQIVKALECCTDDNCRNCPIKQPNATCVGKLMKNSIALIKELADENERVRAATVRKMQERLKSLLVVDLMAITKEQAIFCIDRIAKEMLEGEK